MNANKYHRRPDVLAKNSEKFRTLTIGRFKLQDSLEHMPASLDTLVQDLKNKEKFNFPILRQMKRYKKMTARQKPKALKLLTRKGVFCYEHFQSLEEMDKAQNLPTREEFYSELNEKHISELDYAHAKNVFTFFKCKNVTDYMMLYCSLDVVLLCETFLQYRKMVMEHFQLDPAYYLGKKLKLCYCQIYYPSFEIFRNSRFKF